MNARTKVLVKRHFNKFFAENSRPTEEQILIRVLEEAARVGVPEMEIASFILNEGAFLNTLSKVFNATSDQLATQGNLPVEVLGYVGKSAQKVMNTLTPEQQSQFHTAYQAVVNAIQNSGKAINVAIDALPFIEDNEKKGMKASIGAAPAAALGEMLEKLATTFASAQTQVAEKSPVPTQNPIQGDPNQRQTFAPGQLAAAAQQKPVVNASVENVDKKKVLTEVSVTKGKADLDEVSRRIAGIPE
jgi:hypothetical protein